MPRVYVEFVGLKKLGETCKTVSTGVDEIQSSFLNTVKSLDWDILFESDINETANKISKKLEHCESSLIAFQTFFDDIYTEYSKLNEFKNNIKSTNEFSSAQINEYLSKFIKGMFFSQAFLNPSIFNLLFIPNFTNIIVSGIPIGKTIYSLSELAGSNSSTNADWLGFEMSEEQPGVKAWLGKASSEFESEIGSGEVNAYLGKVEAKTEFGFDFMDSKIKNKYKNGEWSPNETESYLNAKIGASAQMSVAAADASGSVGSDMLGVETKADGSLGNAGAEAKGEISIGEEGVDAYAKAKAMVSAAEGEVEGTVNILGLEITGKVGGYAGALGAEGKVGIEGNKFVLEGGAAALIGGSAGIEIGFNEEGWDNFVDFVVFWD